MAKSKQKKITTDFFNEVSGEWSERTYDPSGQFLKFAGNKARMETVLGEVRTLGIKGKMLDIGCGSGQLVIELLKMGNEARGIDIAEKMIESSKENLRKSSPKANANSIFKTMDLAELEKSDEKYDAVAGLGLLEYLDTDDELFRVLKNVVKDSGYALIECRNKFFNLFSANDYTDSLAKTEEFSALIKSLADSAKYSPVAAEEIPKVQAKVSKEMSDFLQDVSRKKEWFETVAPEFTKYPKGMIRRQHTPEVLEASAKKFGFKLKYAVYWHAHPYPPAFEKKFPKIYNKMAFVMAPLGRTPLGAWMCSSFVAVLEKS